MAAEAVIDKIKEAMARARKISLTTDGWTGKNSMDSFLGVTAHFYCPVNRRIQSLKIGKYSMIIPPLFVYIGKVWSELNVDLSLVI